MMSMKLERPECPLKKLLEKHQRRTKRIRKRTRKRRTRVSLHLWTVTKWLHLTNSERGWGPTTKHDFQKNLLARNSEFT